MNSVVIDLDSTRRRKGTYKERFPNGIDLEKYNRRASEVSAVKRRFLYSSDSGLAQKIDINRMIDKARSIVDYYYRIMEIDSSVKPFVWEASLKEVE